MTQSLLASDYLSRRLAPYPIPVEYLVHYTLSNIRADRSLSRWSLGNYQWLYQTNPLAQGKNRMATEDIFFIYTRPEIDPTVLIFSKLVSTA